MSMGFCITFIGLLTCRYIEQTPITVYQTLVHLPASEGPKVHICISVPKPHSPPLPFRKNYFSPSRDMSTFTPDDQFRLCFFHFAPISVHVHISFTFYPFSISLLTVFPWHWSTAASPEGGRNTFSNLNTPLLDLTRSY